MNLNQLHKLLPELLGDATLEASIAHGELTCEVAAEKIAAVCTKLRDDPRTKFASLMDLCGVDYATFGTTADHAEAVETTTADAGGTTARFAVVYHLLSLENNLRIRLRVRLHENNLRVDSVAKVWPAADWYEREAFDLFGIIFNGHPDLRRLLTDYGFIGHPFRKDFPLSGEVEMRYDAAAGRVIYEPVTVEPRTLVPRTLGKTTA